MKTKLIAGILVLALVATTIGVVSARYNRGVQAPAISCNGFVDENDDGVCDNHGICGHGCGGCGRYFVDADGDGVCDNFGINGRDDDGDGIPNGQDDGYVPPRDGSGRHRGNR
jgi:hypothetical protein